MALFIFCVVVVGAYFIYKYSRKKEVNTLAIFKERSLAEDRWSSPEAQQVRAYQYEKKDGKGHLIYKDDVAYHLHGDHRFNAYQKRTFAGKRGVEEHYFSVRPFDKKDAYVVHEGVKASGKAHFKNYMGHIFEGYGQSVARAEATIMSVNSNNTDDTILGIFHSRDNKHFKFVGFIGSEKATEKRSYEHLEGTLNVYYAMCTKKVTGLRSVMPLVLRGYADLLFYYSVEAPKQLLLNIHKDNKASHGVAEKLGFSNLGENNKYTICCDEEQKIPDMKAYGLTRKVWERQSPVRKNHGWF